MISQDLNLYCIYYADFCKGDTEKQPCSSFEEAQKIVLSKPKDCRTAYQYWTMNGKLYTKPCGKGGYWTNKFTGNGNSRMGHLFVWGYDTGHEKDRRTLIYLKGVDIAGAPSDGHITNNVTCFE